MNYYDVQIFPKAGVCMAGVQKNIVPESLLYRNHAEGEPKLERVSRDFGLIECQEKISGGFYGGFLIQHYGHFLLESLARLHAFEASGHSRIVWINLMGRAVEFNRWQREIFELLGIDEVEHVIVNDPVNVSCLYINRPGYRIKDVFEARHATFLGRIEVVQSDRKVWISRRSEEDGVSWSNEHEVEAQLSTHGWVIVNPRQYSIAQQVQLLAGSKLVAGTVGSAFHTLILAKEIKSKVILFSRGPSKSINRNFLTIGERRAFFQQVHFPRQRKVADGHEGGGAKFEVNVAEVVAPLVDFV